ncbi:MAG: OmpH family outer membrane protein [Bacteroidaceae bacterium]|nr:OmpH family outer membrane protein [Bacteroidaceae bacterium]
MNRIIITFVFALCAMACNAQEASLLGRFAYISYGEVLKSMPAYAAAQKSLADLRANYDNELKRTDEEFSKQFAEYVDGQRTFPENILLKRQKELQQLMEQGLEFKEEARRLLAQAEVELMQPVNKQLKEVIAKIAKERGYAFVLNTDNNAAPFVDGELGDDITADVMEAVK